MTNKVLVTGATGTLGQAVVARFAAAGAHVGIHYRSDESAARVLAETFSGELLQADFGREDVAKVCSKVISVFPANIFILNASAQDVTAWNELTIEKFDDMYRNSLRATAAMLFAAAEHLRTSQHDNKVIVLIGSIEGIRPAPHHAAYSTMKAAIHF